MGIRLGDDLWTLNMQMREEGVDDNVRAETQRPGGAGVGYQGMMEKHRRRPSWGAGRGGGGGWRPRNVRQPAWQEQNDSDSGGLSRKELRLVKGRGHVYASSISSKI